jgi:SulP family sulfate permease
MAAVESRADELASMAGGRTAVSGLGQRLATAAGVSGWREAAREVQAGAVAAVISIAYCLSFAALVFAGPLAAGLPMAVWGFLAASAMATLLVGKSTSLPPVLAAPRNPAVAVMSVMAAHVLAAASARGLGPEAAAQHVLIALSIAALLTGLVLWVLGTFRLGEWVRFVPYPVVAGFLAASGWLLVVGGLKVARGAPFTTGDLARLMPADEALRVGIAIAVMLGLRGLGWLGASAAALPAAFIGAAVVLDGAIWLAGGAPRWFLASEGGAQAWSPLGLGSGLDWGLLMGSGVEILTIVGVSVVALLLDVTSLEVQRRTSADLDREFRAVGASNLAMVAAGGLPVGVALAPSRLLDLIGGRLRLAGIAGGALMTMLLASGVDLASLVPRPVLGGLIIYLGTGLLVESLKAPGRRSWLELALALGIMAAIIWLGYLPGIVLGLIGACLLFAASYSRIGVVRRHVTRASFAAPVERAPEALRQLVEEGQRIHVMWLAGFIFFGSSNGLYERIRSALGEGSGSRRWLVLDCGRVIGIDASAMLSLRKLVDWAAAADVTLVLAGLPGGLAAELGDAGIGEERAGVRLFASRSEALEWCENELLKVGERGSGDDGAGALEAWLARELGQGPAEVLLARYLERRELEAGEVVCALGAPSDTIELVARGSVAVVVPALAGGVLRMRRMTGSTLVGEMGFFRGQPRAASVVAEEAALIYVMTRQAYDRLAREDPALCGRFLELVVRILANRVEAANREIAALV